MIKQKEEKNDLVSQFNCIRSLNNVVFVKDTSSVYHSVSTGFTQLTGYKNINDAIGHTDYDMPCEANILAKKFIEHDRKTLQKQNKIVSLEFLNFSTGFTAVIVEKSPIFCSNNNTVGVYCYAVDVSQMIFFNKMNHHNLTLGAEKQFSMYVLQDSNDSPLPLSLRQQECVYLLVRGKTYKEIAYILGINCRTVESYINEIKHRLSCNSKSQIIEKAIESGFLYHIPKSLIGARIINT